MLLFLIVQLIWKKRTFLCRVDLVNIVLNLSLNLVFQEQLAIFRRHQLALCTPSVKGLIAYWECYWFWNTCVRKVNSNERDWNKFQAPGWHYLIVICSLCRPRSPCPSISPAHTHWIFFPYVGNGNCSIHWLTYLNTLSKVGTIVWGCYRGTTLLEEMHHCGQALRIYSLTAIPIHSLHLLLAVKDRISQLSAPVSCFSASVTMMDFLVLWNHKAKQSLPSKKCLDRGILLK